MHNKFWKILLTVFIIMISSDMHSQPLVEYRAWQFHVMDENYISGAMKLAPQYNINTVVFSHYMIGATSDLYENNRGEELKKLAVEAHSNGLKVWVWVRELDNVPAKYIKDDKVQLDAAGFWEWLEGRYDKTFTDFPEFDGLILTFHECEHKIFSREDVTSNLSMPDRFAKMISTINKSCLKNNKEFIVRTFLYEPIELEWVKEGLLKSDSNIIVQSKCVPHDWDPYYPHNPLIGEFPNNRQIVEFDCSSEFTGRNRVPYTSPEYFEYRWRYDLQFPKTIGYNARLDHDGYDALYTPNEINLYSLYRLTEDANITSEEIWNEWSEKHYGNKAATFIKNALYPSFDIVNKSFFIMQFWITNHSILPDFDYAEGHISSRTIAKWKPDEEKYKLLEEKLNNPYPKLLEDILAEKDTAIALASEALNNLKMAKPFISDSQYEDIYWRLELLHRTAVVWKLHAEAFFGYKIMKNGYDVLGLKERIERSITGLYRQADVSVQNPKLGDLPPASAKEIREVADELAGLLKQLVDEQKQNNNQ